MQRETAVALIEVGRPAYERLRRGGRNVADALAWLGIKERIEADHQRFKAWEAAERTRTADEQSQEALDGVYFSGPAVKRF